MDYQKKKLLTQSVAFLQAHLTLTSDLLLAFKAGGVLTGEELSTIQKDDTPAGKVLELICLVKRKDNRTYNRFMQVLEERQCTQIIELFRAKGVHPEDMQPDPRSVHFLQSFLKQTNVNPRTIRDMACDVVLREVYQDEVQQLQEQLAAVQSQIRPKSKLCSESSSSNSTSEGSGRSTPARTPHMAPLPEPGYSRSDTAPPSHSRGQSRNTDAGAPKWDVPTQQQEIQGLLRQKDDILRRREEEYSKLRSILNDTQNDLQSVLDLNSQYLNIIGQMNQMQRHAAGTPRMTDKDGAMLELERQLADSEQQVDTLQGELGTILEDLGQREAELDKVLRREKKYKSMLGLTAEATEEEVEEKIKIILEDGSLRKVEVDKVKKELAKITANRETLAERLTTLTREKEKIEFHMRQQELTMRKMKRMKVANHTISNAEDMLAAHGYDRTQAQLKLPFIERPGSQLSLASKGSRGNSHQYCVFCRSEYQPAKAANCRMHFRPIRAAKWTCCKDDSHRSAGCLQVPHFYIEITADKRIFLTDGGKYMELT